MSERRAIERVSVQAPLRHKRIHQIPKPIIVTRLNQMYHLMHKNVSQTHSRFFGEFQIDPDTPIFHIAGPPAGLHFLNANLGDLRTDFSFPFGEQWRQLVAELAAIPAMKYRFPGIPDYPPGKCVTPASRY